VTIRVVATGGTIASLADPETGAVRPAVSAADLVATVPGLGPVTSRRSRMSTAGT